MDWWIFLILIFGALIILMLLGIPVFLCFLLINLIGVILFWGEFGLPLFVLNIKDSISSFILLPIPLFILMGEIMFRSGIGSRLIDALDKLLGAINGRLSLVAVFAGTLLSTMSGSSISSVAILGELLMPEMEKRGYKYPMSLGPILGSGGLAVMIPPSGMAIIIAAIAQASIGKMLIAIVIPGLLMAVLYITYILTRCIIQPQLAPRYKLGSIPVSEKLLDTVRYILPIGIVIFLVLGVILLGIATPSEAAASGAVGTIILAAIYGGLKWKMFKESFLSTIRVTGMIFFIIMASLTFSQILAYSQASQGLIEFTMGLALHPMSILIVMLIILIILGMFMSPVAIVMICIPIFMPIIDILGFNQIWMLVMCLICMEMGTTTPPYGMLLFVMQGMFPKTNLIECSRAAFPFLVCDAIAIALVLIFPAIALWLPGTMQ